MFNFKKKETLMGEDTRVLYKRRIFQDELNRIEYFEWVKTLNNEIIPAFQREGFSRQEAILIFFLNSIDSKLDTMIEMLGEIEDA